MTKTFVSPQTGSVYVVVAESPQATVGVRYLGKKDGVKHYRITLRSNLEWLSNFAYELKWSEIKDNDHVSAVADESLVKGYVLSAMDTTGDFEIVNETWLNAVNLDEGYLFVCPNCGIEMHM